MEISLFTNQVDGGWHPNQLETFLGGNEECIVLFSAALARMGHKVTVYSSIAESAIFDKVAYKSRLEFDFDASYDVLITVKDRLPWMKAVDARVKIHWSNDVEPRWADGCLAAVDKVVCMSTYHADRMAWLPEEKRAMIPLGCNISKYKAGEKQSGLMVYATSPDRGLDTLLQDWGRLKAVHPELSLFVTYNWARFAQTPRGQQLGAMLSQPDISHGLLDQKQMAELFSKAEYYVHLLNRPDSDLFGFGLMKAQLAGCKLVLPSVANNGFRDMARAWIPYAEFLKGSTEPAVNTLACTTPQSWGDLTAKHWLPLIAELRATEVRDAG